jgi:hypothetical protein
MLVCSQAPERKKESGLHIDHQALVTEPKVAVDIFICSRYFPFKSEELVKHGDEEKKRKEKKASQGELVKSSEVEAGSRVTLKKVLPL